MLTNTERLKKEVAAYKPLLKISRAEAYALAIAAGIADNSYKAARGYVASYAGKVTLRMGENGEEVQAEGVLHSGDAWGAYNGFIIFFRKNGERILFL